LEGVEQGMNGRQPILTSSIGSASIKKWTKTDMSKSDQRKKRRISVVATAVVRQGPSGPPVEAYLVNISYGGVGLYVKDPLQGRVHATINLRVGAKKRIPVTVSGRVTWTKSVGMMYAVGISFEGLNPKDHGALLSFLENWQTFDQSDETVIDGMPSLTEENTLEEDTLEQDTFDT
jgi:PilZ domain